MTRTTVPIVPEAFTALERLHGLGVAVTADGPDLVLRPASAVPVDLLHLIRCHKADVRRLVRAATRLAELLEPVYESLINAGQRRKETQCQ